MPVNKLQYINEANADIQAVDESGKAADLLVQLVQELGYLSVRGGEIRTNYGRVKPVLIEWDGTITSESEGWHKAYAAANYIREDPMVFMSKEAHQPFTWRQAKAQSTSKGFGMRVFDAAAKYGLHDGVMIPVMTYGRSKAFASICGDTGCWHDLDRVEKAAFVSVVTQAVFTESKFLDYTPIERPELTSRELAFVEWILLNWSDEDIALQLGRNRKHVNRAINKMISERFGVNGRSEFLALLARNPHWCFV